MGICTLKKALVAPRRLFNSSVENSCKKKAGMRGLWSMNNLEFDKSRCPGSNPAPHYSLPSNTLKTLHQNHAWCW